MRVPGGLAVHMFTGVNFRGTALGPYIGPISVSVVDTGEPAQQENDKSQIRSLRIVYYSPIGVDSVKRKIAEENTEEDENDE